MIDEVEFAEVLSTFHPNFICDGCDMKPIIGRRPKRQGNEYDLCEKCYRHKQEDARAAADEGELAQCDAPRSRTYFCFACGFRLEDVECPYCHAIDLEECLSEDGWPPFGDPF